MVYIGIAVAIVAVVLIVFVSLAVLWLTKNISMGARQKASELISAYDNLIEIRAAELESLTTKIEAMEEKKRRTEEESEKIFSGEYSGPDIQYESADIVSKLHSVSYLDPKLSEKYKLIKRTFSINPGEVLAQLNLDEYQMGKATRLLKALDYDTIYRISLLPEETQIDILGGELAGEYEIILKDYIASCGTFSSIGFYEYLKKLASTEPKKPVLYVADGVNLKGVSEDIEVVFDDSICEGFMLVYDNKVYDYCIKEKEIG